MSAYILDRNQINYIVQAAMSRIIFSMHDHASWIWNINREAQTYEREELYRNDYKKANEVGQMLWDENIKSVHARYPEDNLENLPGPIGEDYVFEFHYRDTVPFGHITAIQVLKLLDCYEYQSCEHEEWEKSEAKAFCDSLRRAAIRSLPGYTDAKWELIA